MWSRLARESDDLAGDLTLLDDAERARAERFRFDRDHVRFVGRHAFTRRVLARYLGVDPATIAMRTSTRGRPELDPRCGVSFNVSQADDLTVVAIAQDRRVGVDVERLRQIDDVTVIAERLFAAREVVRLRSVPLASRSRAFLTLWTRKESVVKAVGGGLSIPLDGFTVLTRDGDTFGRPHGSLGALPFAFAPLDGLPGYIGATTLAGPRVAVRSMDAAESIV